jgi:hypothetical protein
VYGVPRIQVLLQAIPFGQFGSLLFGQGGHVLPPTRTPAGVPAPDTAQKRLGIVVIPGSETAILTAMFRQGQFSSVWSGIVKFLIGFFVPESYRERILTDAVFHPFSIR